MLFFFDESFRKSNKGHALGVLAGIAIPEESLSQIIVDVHRMKVSSFGEAFAMNRELKGKKLLKNKNFDLLKSGKGSAAIEFVVDLLRYLRNQRLVVFSVVAFDTSLGTFKCNDPVVLDPTYRILLGRIDDYMKNEYPHKRAKIIFDDIDYKTNAARANCITNFFNRSHEGRGYDTIIRTPFFSVSQAQNLGLQLADVITTVFGLRFEGNPNHRYRIWKIVKSMIYRYEIGKRKKTSIKVFKASAQK